MRHQRGQVPSEDRASSYRSRVLAQVSALTLRPLTGVLPATERGVWASRRLVAGSLAVISPALRGAAVRPVDDAAPQGLRVRGEWVRASGTAGGDAAVLYVHGSGYAVCSARTHRGLTSRLAAEMGLPVFACDYRLAPRHRFPAAADDVRAAYDWLLVQGYEPARMVLAGDSAGGHLLVDLICQLAAAGQAVPAAMVLFSPLIDLTLGLAEERERIRRDPMIPAARARRLVELYTREIEVTHPRLALNPTGEAGWPATLIQAGGAEMLAADAEHLADVLRAAGARSELQEWPGQMHVFQAFAAVLPEARRALAHAATFVQTELARQPHTTPVKETP